ncbi:hypothetical protein GCM10009809_14150 [Isoptericola hypogeus]|uniref:LppM domain-containing protein n=1 Tax=Isoptericola hypogeus TaxID=300179 RepID=A0ABN2J7H1_9MICO
MDTLTRGERRLRTGLAAVLAAVGLLALAGCMKVDMDMTLSEDDTVSGTMVLAFSNQLAETMGMEPGELWDQAGGELEQDLPEGTTQEPYSDDEYTGTQVTFADTPIEDFAGSGGEDLSITREGDEYVVTGTMDLSEGAEQLGSLPQGVQDSFDAQLSVTFPGEVTDSNGEIDGNTVTWTPQMGETTEIQARGAAEAGSSFPWWIVGLVVGILVIALIVVLVLRSRRSGAAPADGSAGVPPTGSPAAFGAAPVADPGTAPGSGTGPTAEEQVFGTRPAAAPEPTSPPGAAPAPSTGPVAEPLEPETPAEPAEPRPDAYAGAGSGPVAEPFEPADPTEPAGPNEPAEPAEPAPPLEPATQPLEPTPPSEPAEPVQPTEPPAPPEPAAPTEPTKPTPGDEPGTERRPTDPPQGA